MTIPTHKDNTAVKLAHVAEELASNYSTHKAAEILDLSASRYNFAEHYPALVAKIAYKLAEAFINEGKNHDN